MDDSQSDTPTETDAPHLAATAGRPVVDPEPVKPARRQKASATNDAGVILRTVFPTDVFEHGVQGASPITAAGTRVSKSAAAQIKNKADDTVGVELEEV